MEFGGVQVLCIGEGEDKTKKTFLSDLFMLGTVLRASVVFISYNFTLPMRLGADTASSPPISILSWEQNSQALASHVAD